MSKQIEHFGKYLLLEKLATGGMAEVYLAKAPGAEGVAKMVAIKRILPQYSQNEEFVEMFKEEAKIVINLNHSNIVSIFEFGEQSNQYFLAMEYVQGKNLRQLLNQLKKTNENLNIEQTLHIVNEMARGLDYAHRAIDSTTGNPLNIIHRDISPQNIMISYDGDIKLVDFGIAKAESKIESTRAGTLKGKFGYMSPEQAEGGDLDSRTDIFSLGIVLWELLAGERLFVANNEINTLRKIRDCQIPSLTKINPQVSLDLEKIVNKALTRNKTLRYQTATDLHKDLSRYLNKHYPDFTGQEFGTYMKNMYAEEIKNTRQKIVEYAKIPFTQDEKTSTSHHEHTRTITDVSKHHKSNPQSDNIKNISEENEQKLLESVDFNKLEVGHLDMKKSKLARSASNTSSGLKENQAHHTASTSTSTLNKTSGSSVSYPTNTGITYFPTGSRSSYGSSKPESHTLQWTLRVMVFALIGLVGWYYLTKTDSGLQMVAKFSGNHFTSISSTASQLSKTPGVHPAPAAAAEDTVMISVISSPSGANIIVNGQDKGITPSNINVPKNQSFQLSIKKDNYLVYEKSMFLTESGQQLRAILQAAGAYITIEPYPMQANLQLFMNEEKLSENLPLVNYAIPANTKMKIRIYNPITKAEAVETVSLPQGTSQRLQLHLKIPTTR